MSIGKEEVKDSPPEAHTPVLQRRNSLLEEVMFKRRTRILKCLKGGPGRGAGGEDV